MIFFFFNDTATTEIYTLSLHDALPICLEAGHRAVVDQLPELRLRERLDRLRDARHQLPRHAAAVLDRKSTRLNSSHLVISYAVFCLKKKNIEFSLYLSAFTWPLLPFLG